MYFFLHTCSSNQENRLSCAQGILPTTTTIYLPKAHPGEHLNVRGSTFHATPDAHHVRGRGLRLGGHVIPCTHSSRCPSKKTSITTARVLIDTTQIRCAPRYCFAYPTTTAAQQRTESWRHALTRRWHSPSNLDASILDGILELDKRVRDQLLQLQVCPCLSG